MSPQRPQPGHGPATPQPREAPPAETPTVSLRGPTPESTAAWTPLSPTAASSSPPKPVGKLGRFELRERLGGGSFGEVFRAYDPKLDREVALKIARSHYLDNPDEHERFFREARAAAQFAHPHIVPIYEVGQEDRVAYIVAALIEGTTLGDVLAAKRPSPADAVRIALELADAVHYAHLKGVFHRDLKPGNVMVDLAGTVHLTDFGLARRSEGEALQTQAGEVLGTPAYMSPEQARGDSRLVDARSDLYSLGVILYELLCGQRPFRGSIFEVLKQVQEHEPDPLRKFDPHVPKDLEAICLKAMAKLPDDRYPSVEHFAEDLRRWQRHEPVRACRTGPLVRLQKWVRRHPLATGVVAATLAGLVAYGVYWQTRPAWLDVRVTPMAAGTRVELGGQSLPIDKDGRVFVAHAPGRYRLAVSAKDHEPHEREVLLVRGKENAAVAAIELDPRFGFASLTSDPDGAGVEITDAAGMSVARGTTPFHSPRLPAGTYSAEVQRDLYAPQTVKFDVPIADRLTTVPSVKLEPMFQESAGYAFVQTYRKRMQQPIQAVSFVEMRLQDAIALLRQQERIDLILDVKKLEEAGVSPQAPVTLDMKGVSLESALKLLLQPLELTFTPERLTETRWGLRITTPEAAESSLSTVLYQVRDLVAKSEGGADFDSLIDAIQTNVSPPSWNDVGGPGSMTVMHDQLLLSVSHNWNTQVAVDDYLAQLRQARLAAERTAPRNPRLEKAVERIRRLGGQVTRNEIDNERSVTTINLAGRPVTDEDFAEFPPLPQLQSFSLTNGPTTSQGLTFLKDSPELTQVFLNWTKVDRLDFLASASKLNDLFLQGAPVSDEGLAALANHASLLRLDLYRCPVTSEGLKTIKSLRSLRYLTLSGTNISDEGLVELAGHGELVSLHLGGVNCGDRAAEILLTLPKLREFTLPNLATDGSLKTLRQHPGLYAVNIGGTQITSDGLVELQHFPALRSLALSGKNFDDRAIPHLRAAASLQHLTLRQTKVSPQGLQQLRAARPKLQVFE